MISATIENSLQQIAYIQDLSSLFAVSQKYQRK